MSAKDKGFTFKQLFFRDAASVQSEEQSSKTEPVAYKPQDDYVSGTATNYQAGAADQSLVDDFVNRLQNLINQNNQPGFDFMEFTESLFEEKQNPGPEVYKTVFRIAQKMDKSLTPARLIESAAFYKDLVQRTADGEVNKGMSKKQSLQTEKSNEKDNLDSSLKSTRAKIQQLTKQIQDLQNQEVTLNGQLLAIDQKYNNQFVDIDRKITAINNAKEQVISSIVDIESGIKSNLS
jgi:hypothetical protein